MSTEGLGVDEAVRTMLLLMPRLVGRAKRLGVPDELRDLELAPRHLSLLAYLLFDGPLGVTELAERLEVAPTRPTGAARSSRSRTASGRPSTAGCPAAPAPGAPHWPHLHRSSAASW